MSAIILGLAAAALMARDDDFDRRETRVIQLRYGECVVKKQYAAVKAFVLTPDLEKRDYRRSLDKVADGACLMQAVSASRGVEMRFPTDTMRYVLADALVRREFQQTGPSSLKDAGTIDQPDFDEPRYQPKPGKKTRDKELEQLAAAREKRLALIYLAQYGECVVRANTVQSRSLLMATPDSPAEVAAFSALKPMLGHCVTEGHRIVLNKVTLRGTIAMNYYRLAHAPRPPAMSSGASR